VQTVVSLGSADLNIRKGIGSAATPFAAGGRVSATAVEGDIYLNLSGDSELVTATAKSAGTVQVYATGSLVLSSGANLVGTAVTLGALGGSLTAAGPASIKADTVRLSASGSIGQQSRPLTVEAETLAFNAVQGDVYLMASDRQAGAGSTTLSLMKAGGALVYTQTAGDLALGAGLAATAGSATITVAEGDLNAGKGSNIVANSLSIAAKGQIGNQTDSLATRVGQLSAVSQEGEIALWQTSDVTITSAGIHTQGQERAVTLGVQGALTMADGSSVSARNGSVLIASSGNMTLTRVQAADGDIGLLSAGKILPKSTATASAQVQTEGAVYLAAKSGIGGFGLDRLLVDAAAVSATNIESGDIVLSGVESLRLGSQGIRNYSANGDWVVLMGGQGSVLGNSGRSIVAQGTPPRVALFEGRSTVTQDLLPALTGGSSQGASSQPNASLLPSVITQSQLQSLRSDLVKIFNVAGATSSTGVSVNERAINDWANRVGLQSGPGSVPYETVRALLQNLMRNQAGTESQSVLSSLNQKIAQDWASRNVKQLTEQLSSEASLLTAEYESLTEEVTASAVAAVGQRFAMEGASVFADVLPIDATAALMDAAMTSVQSPKATQASRYVPADFETYRGTSGGSSTAAPVDSPKGPATPEAKQPVGPQGPASTPAATQGGEQKAPAPASGGGQGAESGEGAHGPTSEVAPEAPAVSSLDWLNALLAKAREEPPEDGA
jgi:hypothetical protein